jgi:hypothetical protein
MAQTYNPIIKEEKSPQITLFKPRLSREANAALVLFREGMPLTTLWPNDRLTAGEAAYGRYSIIYHVDITEHILSFDCALPCKGDAFSFNTKVSFTCAVNDPATIVKRKYLDALAVIQPNMISTMRQVSRQFDLGQGPEAEKALVESINHEKKGYNLGFRIERLVIELTLEQAARDHQRQIVDLSQQAEVEKIKAKNTYDIDRLRQQHDLDKDSWSRDKSLLDAEHELKVQKVKHDYYLPIVQKAAVDKSYVAVLATVLARNPGDMTSVIGMLKEQEQIEYDRLITALKIAIDADVLEGFQIEESAKHMLSQLVENLGVGRNLPELPSSQKKSSDVGDEESNS